jgi:hypothetical protein
LEEDHLLLAVGQLLHVRAAEQQLRSPGLLHCKATRHHVSVPSHNDFVDKDTTELALSAASNIHRHPLCVLSNPAGGGRNPVWNESFAVAITKETDLTITVRLLLAGNQKK